MKSPRGSEREARHKSKYKQLDRGVVLFFLLFVCGNLFILYEAFFSGILPTRSLQIAVVLGVIACLLHGARTIGIHRTKDLFLLTIAVTLITEIIGVSTGWLFGGYQYNLHLGNQFFDLVPIVIPSAWFMMLYPSYIIAMRVSSEGLIFNGKPEIKIAALGATIMTSWDIVIDPVMVLAAYWQWEIDQYYGIPYSNYIGWFVVSFIVLYAFIIKHPIGDDNKHLLISGKLATVYYGLVGLCSVVAAITVGLVWPAILGMIVMSLWVILGWRSSSRYSNLEYNRPLTKTDE